MLQIHPKARPTPVIRAEIAGSNEPPGILAQRYGVSTEMVRQWRQRGTEDCLDYSARPTHPGRPPEEERVLVCALRRSTHFALDDLPFVVPIFCRLSIVIASGVLFGPKRLVGDHGLAQIDPNAVRAASKLTTSALSTSTANIYPSCRPATANGAGAISRSPSTGARAPCIERSRRMRPKRAPSAFCRRRLWLFPFASLLC